MTQCASTEAILSRPKEEDKFHSKRIIDPIKAWADPYYVRHITPDEFVLVETTRRKQKNTKGQSELSSVSKEKREIAINSYLYSPPAENVDREKIVGLVEYKSEPPVVKPTLFQRFKKLFKTENQSLADKIKIMNESEKK